MMKLAHRSSEKAINVKGWSKQKVQLDLNILDPTTSAGLLQIIDDYPTDIAYSTAQFIECFQKIWNFLNIKTP